MPSLLNYIRKLNNFLTLELIESFVLLYLYIEQQNHGIMKNQGKDGKFIKSAIWIDKICEKCGTKFQVKESDLKYGRGKCCSRKCVDENKKQTYKGELNPMYGKILSDEEKLLKSEIMKEIWKDDEYRNRVKISQSKFQERASKDGTWDRARIKAQKTHFEKYGKLHNWNGKYGERKCDKTFVKNNGMTSIEYAASFLDNNRTSIEIYTEFILNENNIENISQYNYKGYNYDFFLPVENILIECDGDYWHGFDKPVQHGFGKLDDALDEPQKRSRENDKIKNKLAKSGNIKLLRFWEHEIHQQNFDKLLLKKIWEKK